MKLFPSHDREGVATSIIFPMMFYLIQEGMRQICLGPISSSVVTQEPYVDGLLGRVQFHLNSVYSLFLGLDYSKGIVRPSLDLVKYGVATNLYFEQLIASFYLVRQNYRDNVPKTFSTKYSSSDLMDMVMKLTTDMVTPFSDETRTFWTSVQGKYSLRFPPSSAIGYSSLPMIRMFNQGIDYFDKHPDECGYFIGAVCDRDWET